MPDAPRGVVLVTGGAGYIGSHAVVELLEAGYEPVVLDNLCNASAGVLSRIERITGRRVRFYESDVRDGGALARIFEAHRVDAVMHFAGLKAVGESVAHPLAYYDNNVSGTLALCAAMQRYGVRSLVFSSSASVYGEQHAMPIAENAPEHAASPYGRTKLVTEGLLRDLAASEPGWNVALLRYFNPAGAHPSGLIGEQPCGTPSNLMPVLCEVACGLRPALTIFGTDYPTADGTAVRDYIHVVDLVRGHLAALAALAEASGVLCVNLGTGCGSSVLEIADAFERATDRAIPRHAAARRPGDVAVCYADPALALEKLGWRARRTLADMCVDAWRWRVMNPDGYARDASPARARAEATLRAVPATAAPGMRVPPPPQPAL